MPAGKSKLLAMLTWDNPTFKLKAEFGSGIGSDHGQELLTKTADSVPLVFEYSIARGSFKPEQYYVSLSAQNIAQLKGQKANLLLKAFLY